MLIGNKRLKELALSIGLDQMGIAPAKPLNYLQDRLEKRASERRISPFEEKEPTLRLSTDQLIPGCQSIIVFLVPYLTAMQPLNSPKTTPPLSGEVAACARGIDYHHFSEYKATQLVNLLKKETGKIFNFCILTDRSPLVERELARISGLGWIGENCTLINPSYGSYTTISTILIDHEIEPDQPLPESCLECGKCLIYCPTGAFCEPFVLDPYRCLSYLSQASGIFPRELRGQLGKRIYGCDSCLDICPQNNSIKNSPFKELRFSYFPAEPLLLPLLQITQNEFEITIGISSAGWRGKTTLQRNAVIAAGNSENPDAVSLLSKLLENDSRPLIRLHSAWALGQINSRKALDKLEKAMRNDPDDMVKQEITWSLEHAT